ncbi:MAG: hypothetical protein ACYSTX_00085 [Planctomycetota bacterium]|jgi:hypothetical protein
MKKLLTVLVAIFFVIPIFNTPALAAWTKTLELDSEYTRGDGRKLFRLKLTVTSDASASGDITLSTELESAHGTDKGKTYMQRMAGGVLYGVEYVPDGSDTPTSQGTITIDTADGTLLFSEQVAVAGTAEFFNGDVDAGTFPPFTDLIIACTTLADTKKAIIYIYILK